MSLYMFLLLISVSIPLGLSFDKKLAFYKKWPVLFPSMIFVAVLYIIPDIIVTKMGVWGFNPEYHSSIKIWHLPLEEWLFFILIPYASLFGHYSFITYFPQVKVPMRMSRFLTVFLISANVFFVLYNIENIYTVYILSLLIFTLILGLIDKTGAIGRFYVTFLLVLVPFILVNATLTGTFIDGEVVWYNDNENLGIRLLTIPIEDFAYAFTLIFLNILLVDNLTNKIKKVHV